jgi:hypothetical protein
MKTFRLILALAVVAAWVTPAYANEPKRKPASHGGSSDKLDFEDDVVEGAGNPLDSLNQMSRRDRKKDPHLYKKRENFYPEVEQTVMDLGVKP